MKSKYHLVILIFFAIIVQAPLQVKSYSDNVNEKTMNNSEKQKIKITVGETVLSATLNNSTTSRDFISLLPLTLTLEDYAGTEKISDLPKKLSTEDTPSGSDPSVGDITYYVPWGNLAIFYRDFGYSTGLVIMGKIDSGIDAFNVPGTVGVKMELMEQKAKK